MNSAKVSGLASVSSALVTICVGVLAFESSARMVVDKSSILSPPEVTRTENVSSSSVMKLPSVGSRDRSLAAWCLTSVQLATLKSRLDGQTCHRASLPVVSAKFKIHRGEL